MAGGTSGSVERGVFAMQIVFPARCVTFRLHHRMAVVALHFRVRRRRYVLVANETFRIRRRRLRRMFRAENFGMKIRFYIHCVAGGNRSFDLVVQMA